MCVWRLARKMMKTAFLCAGQDEGEMTIFTAKVQRCKEAKKQGEVFFSSPLCTFASLQ
jgi:hypothetical protein